MNLRNEPHDGSEPGPGPLVYVRFKSSSQPKGQDGYEIAVASGATRADIDDAVYMAAIAREQAIDVLEGTAAATLKAHHETAAAIAEAARIAAVNEPDRAAWDDQIEDRMEARREAYGRQPTAAEQRSILAGITACGNCGRQPNEHTEAGWDVCQSALTHKANAIIAGVNNA